MPIYDYECQNKKCKHTEEFLMKLGESDIALECPKCHMDMHRAWGVGNIEYKYTRRYVDENGVEQIIPCSPPSGVHKRRKKTIKRKGDIYVIDKRTGESVKVKDRNGG